MEEDEKEVVKEDEKEVVPEDEKELVQEEKKETIKKEKNVNDFLTKTFKWIKKNWIVVASAVAGIIVAIVLMCAFSGTPRKAVKKFIKAFNSCNAKKIVSSMDIAGSHKWQYSYYENEFSEDDYDEFIDNYENMDKDRVKELKEEITDEIDEMFDGIKNNYKTYKMKIKEIKSVKKLGKGLYAVKVKLLLSTKPKDKNQDKKDEIKTTTFIVYDNKVIYSDFLA